MSDNEVLFDGHRIERCQGRWIDVGTFRDPFKQLCSGCRAGRQKPMDEESDADVVDVLNAADARTVRGLGLLRADMLQDLEDRGMEEAERHLDEHRGYPTVTQIVGATLILMAMGAAFGIMVYVKVTGG